MGCVELAEFIDELENRLLLLPQEIQVLLGWAAVDDMPDFGLGDAPGHQSGKGLPFLVVVSVHALVGAAERRECTVLVDAEEDCGLLGVRADWATVSLHQIF